MRILNLGCGSKTSQNPDVLNIDWSVSLIIKKNFFLRILLSKFLSKERQDNFRKLPNNIIVHDLKKGLPYENNSVDAVYHSHLLEHIDRSMVKNFLLDIFTNNIIIIVSNVRLIICSYVNFIVYYYK